MTQTLGVLEGKVAVVTGSTRGIGFGIARELLAQDAQVLISSRSADKGKAALEVLDAGDRVTFVAADVMVKEDCEHLIDAAVDVFGRLDILVNNAGGAASFSPLATMTDQAWFDTLNWNLNSTFFCTRRALPHMLSAGWGRVINVSSLEGKVGKPGISNYCSAKHAVHGFTKSVAQEVGQAGITVNAICPGLVPTDIIADQFSAVAASMGLGSADELTQLFLQHTATKQPNTVAEMANVVRMLTGPDSAGITGAIFSVDGGSAPY